MSSTTVGVSTGELGRRANELRGSGGAVGTQVPMITESLFGPGDAGANYQSQGTTIQAGLEQLRQRLADWSAATLATADAIDAAAAQQTSVDAAHAADIGRQQ